jgi:pimeloyl-ACP methyl ester carboxylesterase
VLDALERFWFFAPPGRLPTPTPAEGPDPYGNPNPDWLRIDWREHLHTIGLDGATVNYVEMGEPTGVDLVLVHGLSGSWQNWLENIPFLAQHHRVLALDLPGFGASPMPSWEISIERYGRLLVEFCDALSAENVVVIGNSMGGFVSAEAAIKSPGRFEKLALVSAAGVSHARMRREPAEMAGRLSTAASPIVLRFQERGLLRPGIRHWAFRMLFHYPTRIRRELIWEFFMNGAGKPGFLPSIGALMGYDILDRLEEVDIPALVVWGRNDRIVRPADALEYAERLGNSRLVIFDKTGHVAMAERPVRFNRLLKAFLDE